MMQREFEGELTGYTEDVQQSAQPYASMYTERIDRIKIKFENRNMAVFNIASRYSVVIRRIRAKSKEENDVFVIIVSILDEDGLRPIDPIQVDMETDTNQLAAHLIKYLDSGAVDGIASAIVQVIRYFDLYWLQYEAKLVEVRKTGFHIEDLQKISALNMVTKPTAKEQLAEFFADVIVKRHHLATIHDDLLCYKEGVYEPCKEDILGEIESIAERTHFRAKITKSVVNEIIDKLKRRTIKKPEEIGRDRFVLAFKNGLFDVKEWVETGSFTVQEFNPSIYSIHKIPHRLDQDLFRRMIEDEGIGLFTHPVDIAALAEKYSPKTWKAYVDWVGEEQAPLLYEIEGYTLYPDYPLHKAFLLVGEGANGKTTFLNKLKKVLGPWNVVSISLVKLTDPSQRFAVAELYKKLANLSGELPGKKSRRIKDPDAFKKLVGGDLIEAERKFRDPFYFMNYAKMIFSANRLPEVDEDTHAWWRRWVVIKFPNQFPEDPTFFDRTFTKAEIEAGIIVSLFALRNVLLRRSFTVTKVNAKEEWMRRSNNVYRFVKEMLEGGYIELSPEAFVLKADLYSLYVKWARDVDEDPKKKRKFTEDLMRFFGVKPDKKKIRGRTENVYFGIRIVKNPYEEESEDESDQGLLGWA